MPSSDQPQSPGLLRRLARRMRRVALAALLVAIGLLAYLHQVGLPGFARETLVEELRTHGLELDAGRIVLRWYRGIVAERVSLGPTESEAGPRLYLPEVAIRLHVPSLVRSQLVVRSIELQGGRFVWPLKSGSDGAPVQDLALEGTDAELRFAADGTWHLDRLEADCLGFQLHLRGTLTHASNLRAWRYPARADPTPRAWEQTLHRVLLHLQRLEFDQPPRLTAEFEADATRPESTRALLCVDAGPARSPWGSIDALQGSVRLQPGSERAGRAAFDLQLAVGGARSPGLRVGNLHVATHWAQPFDQALPESVGLEVALRDLAVPWGSLSRLDLAGNGRRDPDQPHLLHLDLALEGGTLSGGGGELEVSEFAVRWVHDIEQAFATEGDWRLRVRSPRFDWGQAELATLEGRFARTDTWSAVPEDAVPAGWRWLVPWSVHLTGQLDRLAVAESVFDRVAFEAAWHAPALSFDWIEIDLFDRRLRGALACQVPERTVTGTIAFDFDVRRLGPLLPPGVHRWLEPYGWSPHAPPVVRAQARLRLPPWDQLTEPAAWSEVEESLGVQGSLVAVPGAYQGISMDSVMFDFQFTNAMWRLTDFVAHSPEGRLAMTYAEDQRTGDYRFDLDARLDPRVFRTVVPPNVEPAFDFFEFDEPPAVQGYVAGRWRAAGRTEFSGSVRTASLRFRGEPIEELEAQLAFTNGVVRATGVRLRSEGWILANVVEFDLARQRLSLVDVLSTVPPLRVARAIGDEVVQTLSPYVFERPPQAQVEGWLNVRDTRQAALRFELDGGPFRYWRFQLPRIEGLVHWTDETVRVENLRGPFYDGRLSGHVDVDLAAAQGADFSFHARVDSVDFQRLMTDLLPTTNRLEGRLSGSWTVTRANSEDWDSWNGLGQVELRDGYLWDLPLFGGFSDLMDRLKVEVGRNPIKGLNAYFTMTNSLIHTRNLQLQSAAMRLDYRGTFDFEGAVNARVEAKLLHETAVVGPLVSLLFSPLTKIFEFRVTGTLGAPKLEPVYVPKPLLFPLNPIGTLRELLHRPSQGQEL